MAAQQSVTPLKGLFDAQTQQEVTKHAGDEWKAGFENLPPGIRGGRAKLSDIQFKQYDAKTTKKRLDGSAATGEWYVQFVGTVFWPHEHPAEDGNLFKCFGKQTRQQIALMDQKWGQGTLTKAQAIQRAMDEMKRLANNRYLFCNVDHSPKVVTEQLLVQVANDLVAFSNHPPQGKHGLFFDFTTSKGSGNGVFENWNGSAGLEAYVPVKPGTAGVKDGNQQPTQQQPAQAAPQATPQTQIAASQSPPQQPPATAAASQPGDGPPDIELLVRLSYGDAASPETGQAQTRLIELAVAAGHPREEVEADKTWEDIAARLKSPKTAQVSAQQPVNGSAPSTNGQWPSVGDLVRFTKAPLLDRTRQPIPGKHRQVEAELQAAHADGTYDLLDWNDRQTVYQKVAKADLQPV